MALPNGTKLGPYEVLGAIGDGKWLALTLVDGSTTNLYLLPTKGGPPRQITSFGSPTEIARRVAWSSDSMYVYAAVSHKDADVVLLTNLLQ